MAFETIAAVFGEAVFGAATAGELAAAGLADATAFGTGAGAFGFESAGALGFTESGAALGALGGETGALGGEAGGFGSSGLSEGGTLASSSNFVPGTSAGGFGMGGPVEAAGGFGWGDAAKLVTPGLSLASSLSGLEQAKKMRQLAMVAQTRGDPFGASGGRSLADTQLQELMRDPGQVAAGDPAYKLRIQAAQRATAPYGQNSGAMNVAAANASTDWYNQRLQQLGGLAGAGNNPAAATSAAMQGQLGAANLTSQSLASLGFGVNAATGGTATAAMPPAVKQWFQQQGWI